MSGMIRSLNEESDARTQFTASDAMICKFSSSSKGYFKDPFLLKMICKDTSLSLKPQQLKKPPIINRGYYARVHSIHQIIDKFMNILESENGSRKQIISLGSGFDTLSLQLLQRGDKDLHIYEVDFEEIIQKKVNTFLSEPSIEELLKSSKQNLPSSINHEKSGIHLEHENAKYNYNNLHFISGDLRNSNEVIRALQKAGLDIKAPTLILTECVLVYMTVVG
jgi:tRNA wybutosine-synthesizing protein 4